MTELTIKEILKEIRRCRKDRENIRKDREYIRKDREYWSNKVKELSLRAVEEQYSVSKIAEASGVSRTTVYNWINETD